MPAGEQAGIENGRLVPGFPDLVDKRTYPGEAVSGFLHAVLDEGGQVSHGDKGDLQPGVELFGFEAGLIERILQQREDFVRQHGNRGIFQQAQQARNDFEGLDVRRQAIKGFFIPGRRDDDSLKRIGKCISQALVFGLYPLER